MHAENITNIPGLELTSNENGQIFASHIHFGKDPDAKFLYITAKKIADMFAIPHNAASFMCSDEEMGIERVKRAFYWSKVFATDIVGPVVLSQPSHVANNPGHSSQIYFVTGHTGMYKNSDGRILYGKLESERDEILRPTCGAIFHVMQRLLGKEHPENMPQDDVDLIGLLEQGLLPYKEELMSEYNKGADGLEKYSLGMRYLTLKNIEIQVEKLLKMLIQSSSHDRGQITKLVFGAFTINRYKYPDTTLLTQAYMLDNGIVRDLAKIPLKNATRHQAH